MDLYSPDGKFLQGDENLTAAARQMVFAFNDFWTSKLPPRTKIEHIGATAVPGCLTRGHLDICVMAMQPDFEEIREKLAGTYSLAPDIAESDVFASFLDEDCRPILAIQLVVRDGAMDIFTAFRDVLLQKPAVLAAYNNMKRAHSGKRITDYRAAQDEFITHVLTHGTPPGR